MYLRAAEAVYYMYFAVMTLAKGLGLYDGMWPYTAALCIGAVLVIVKLALTEQTLAEWIYTIAMICLGVVIWRNSDQTGALIYITMIVAMKNVPVKRLFSIGLVIWGTTFIALTILTITGLKSDIFMVHEKLGLGFIIRWSLGQPHPNVLQITFLIICAFILYLANWKGKKLICATLIMLAANLYIFFYSISYTGLILVFIYLFANLYLSLRKELSRLERVLVNLVFPACAAFAVLGPVVFKGKLWELCDKALNTRFNIAKHHLTLDPISLFGARPSEAVPSALHNIDSSYVFVLMRYGLVLFVLLCVGYMALIRHCEKEKKYKELAIIIGLAVAAIAEPFFVNPSFKNISLLFLGEFIFRKFGEFAERKPDHILNRKWILCRFGEKEIAFPVGTIVWLKKCYLHSVKKYRKLIAAVMLGVGILAGAVFSVTADMPSKYYALRSSTQVVEKEWIYLDIENLPEDFEGKILNYKDAETPMQVFEGNITKMEYARGIVSSGLWCGVFAGVLISAIMTLQYWKKSIQSDDKSKKQH